MKKIIFIFMFFCFCSTYGQDYQAKIFEYQKDTLPYRVLLPKNFSPEISYPLLVVLHGSGERGNDNSSQLVHGSYLFQSEEFKTKYPAIVVFPQCPKDSYWANVLRDYAKPLDQIYTYSDSLPDNPQLEIVEALMLFLEERYLIDPTRRYVGGLSMGGMGTFELVSRNPDYYCSSISYLWGWKSQLGSFVAQNSFVDFFTEKKTMWYRLSFQWPCTMH